MQVDPLERFLILLTRIGHQADRSLGDRRHRAAALRPRAEEDHAHDSVAERRRARVRQHPLLARRQAAVLLRRRRADPRDDELHRGRYVAAEPADRSRAWAASTSGRSTTSTTTRASSPACSRRRTRCRTAASWASAASTSCAKTIDFTPIGPAEGVGFAHGARPQARLRPDAADRPLRVLGLRPRRRSCSAARAFEGRRAWRCACRRTASCSTSTRPAPRSTSTTPRRTSCLRTIELNARPDDRAVRPAAQVARHDDGHCRRAEAADGSRARR